MPGVAIVVFSDLVESTALLASLGDDRMERIRRAHVKEVSEAVTGNGGRVVKTMGDGVMSSFESALGALRAAAAIQAAVERQDTEQGEIGIAARVGVAAGEPIADGEDLHGMSVVIASRLSSAAETGEVLVHDLVRELVASRDGVSLSEDREYELKGVPRKIRASSLLWRELASGAGGGEISGRADPGDAPFVSPRLPPVLAAYAEEPLIGRDHEISTLREETAPRPGCRAVLVLGEPGIGKTRHAAAAAIEAHDGGATVVLARCPPETVVPFEPWVRAIGELAQSGDDRWRSALAEAAGPELLALVPELNQGDDPRRRTDTGALIAAEGARYRLLCGIGAALGCAAGSRSLHVVLDDAQWCDPASAQALRHLIDRPPADELVLVMTAREGEIGRGHPMTKALADLRRTNDLTDLRLAGLDSAGMAALVDARVGRAITPALATQLLERTAGNPFFAGELARDLEGRGALRDGEALAAAPVPDAVAGLVEERLAQLDPTTERLLAALAAIGPSAAVNLAGRAAGMGREEAERAAWDALQERLVEYLPAAEPTVTFTHALVREALLADSSDAASARLHLAVARALEEDPETEPAELARHYMLAVDVIGAEPAMAASRAAADAAAEGHDHEAAAAHLRQLLSLIPEAELASRAPVLLDLGEQELLSADRRARGSYRRAVEAARATGDGVTLARAALGFAGGDVGFGWETGGDHEAVALLGEGLEALGESEPRLALRMIFRLSFLVIYTDEDETVNRLARRAEELADRIDDPEARVLGTLTRLVARCARRPDPLDFEGFAEDMESLLRLVDEAEECGREDLLFRVVQHATWVNYVFARIADCEQAIERGAEIAARLGAPRFAWEAELNRAMRLFDRGEYQEAAAISRVAGAVGSRLRPDIQAVGQLSFVTLNSWIFEGETEMPRRSFEALNTGPQRGLMVAAAVAMQALDGDLVTARGGLREALDNDLERVRCPDGHLPAAICFLAEAAVTVEDVEAGARLRLLLEPMRGHLLSAIPASCLGFVPEAYIGRLDLVSGRVEEAVGELRRAVGRADDLDLVWARGWIRVDLARALHRRGDEEEALEVLDEAEAIAARHGVGWATRQAAEARSEFAGGRGSTAARPSPRSKPIRALAARGGRRALAAMVRDLGDAEVERRFLEPRRQRALLRGMARGFQPAQAAGFQGAIVYELEPLAIEAPPDAPWRWALEVDGKAGHAHLLDPAPLDPEVCIYCGLADWVRITAGLEDPLMVMVDGRSRVEGDISVVVRLEAMFGGG